MLGRLQRVARRETGVSILDASRAEHFGVNVGGEGGRKFYGQIAGDEAYIDATPAPISHRDTNRY
jgi:hypothetical protein